MASKRSPSETGRAVALFVILKLLILWFGVQAYMVIRNESLPTPQSWLGIWNQWDAPHYLDIVRDGYVTEGDARRWIVFFPLFPWVTRVVDFVVQDPLTSAFLVSTVASLFVAALFFRLVRLDEDVEIAQEAVWYLSIFPTAYFLHIGYTESLFLALTLGCFLAARKGNWAVAGIVGALAALTRVNGALLAPALAVEAFLVYRRTRRIEWRWLWILAIGAGTAVYLWVNYSVTGDMWMFRRYQDEHWNHSFSLPFFSMVDAWRGIWLRPASEAVMVGWQELLFTIIAIAATVWSWFRLRASYALWATLNLALFTSAGILLGVPRYSLALFPIFVCFAKITPGRPLLRAVIVAWSLSFLALFASRFVTQNWAF